MTKKNNKRKTQNRHKTQKVKNDEKNIFKKDAHKNT